MHGHGRAPGELAERGRQTGVELGRREPERELAQLVDRDRDLRDGLVERAAGALRGLRRELVLRVAERQADRDEPLLRAVVQVTLDPATLLVRGRDDPGTGVLDLRELTA